MRGGVSGISASGWLQYRISILKSAAPSPDRKWHTYVTKTRSIQCSARYKVQWLEVFGKKYPKNIYPVPANTINIPPHMLISLKSHYDHRFWFEQSQTLIRFWFLDFQSKPRRGTNFLGGYIS